MGSACSKTSSTTQGHTLAGPPSTTGVQPAPHPNPVNAAAEAAERRLKAAQARGTSSSNPNKGRLAAQLEASKVAKKVPETGPEERVVWD